MSQQTHLGENSGKQERSFIIGPIRMDDGLDFARVPATHFNRSSVANCTLQFDVFCIVE